MERYNNFFKEKKIIIYGYGNHFKNLYSNIRNINIILPIRYICDSDKCKEGKVVILEKQQLIINNPNIIKNLSSKEYVVLIASTFVSEIVKEIQTFNNEIEYYTLDYIAGLIRRDMISLLEDNYNIDYANNVVNWIKIAKQDEIDFWDTKMASLKDKNIENYEFKYSYANLKLNETSYVLDIGSGPVPLYGNLYNGKKFNYIPIDPLAHQYSRLREKFNIKLPVSPVFGIMEHMTLFYKKDSIDYIIVNNALDHCIDIVRALIEMIIILKKGGIISLVHNECVGFRWNYNGLHQWDITKSSLNELLVANKKQNRINISKLFANFTSITITEKMTDKNNNPLLGGGCINKIIVEIEKTNDVPDDLIEKMSNKIAGGLLISSLFKEIYQI